MDRDFRSEDVVKKVEATALESNLDVVFWKRKEIENYLLVPEAIFRALSGHGDANIELKDVVELLDEVVQELLPELEG